MLIGHKIKSIRELKNYTQQYVADQLGITQAGYSKIEKGNINLSLEKLEQLAIILEVPLENIINFEINGYFNQNRNAHRGHNSYSQKSFDLVTRLYEDKIALLEKLIGKTDEELQFYKEKCALL